MPETALITGASSGIGYAIAKNLLQKEMLVHGVSRQNTLFHERFIHHQIDLSKSFTLPKIDCPDVLILNAGAPLFAHLEQISDEAINKLFTINTISPIQIVSHFLPEMKRRKSGLIIFIGSEAIQKPRRLSTIYSATKSALRSFSIALRDEVASSSIAVSFINPGLTKTPFYDSLFFEPGDEKTQHLLPQDIADAVSFIVERRNMCVIDEIDLSCMSPSSIKRKHEINNKKI